MELAGSKKKGFFGFSEREREKKERDKKKKKEMSKFAVYYDREIPIVKNGPPYKKKKKIPQRNFAILHQKSANHRSSIETSSKSTGTVSN